VKQAASAVAALGALGASTWLLVTVGHVTNTTTVALTFLLLILLVAAASRLWVAILTSVAAMLSFNYFFIPPTGTFTIADPNNWVALGAFLVVGVVASNLSSRVRAQAREALARRDELARLFDLSRDILLTTDSVGAVAASARYIARRFELDQVAICLPGLERWAVHAAGPAIPGLTDERLNVVLARAQGTLEFDADARSYGGHHARRHDGGRPAASGRPADRAGDTRRAGRRGGDCGRARSLPGGTEGGRSRP
jgi:two-component system sensor histidine kinase KdpD